MKITVLDGKTTNPGDLDWQELSSLGQLTVYGSSAPDTVAERSRDSEALIINKIRITDALLEELPNLSYIGMLATGYDMVDTSACSRRGITVANVPGYSRDSVAQCTFALLLELKNHTAEFAHLTRRRQWVLAQENAYRLAPISELSGKVMGILGYGDIGAAVGKIAAAFNMEVLAFARRELRDLPSYARQVEFDELLSCSDVLSIHCPLTEDTKEMINAAAISKMKNSAVIINTARGGIIDDCAVYEALCEKRLAGAGLDVLTVEPAENNILMGAPNCIITPHVAWAAKESRRRLISEVAANLRAFQSGERRNVVTE
ncbi:MAG: D-2-hydroxyacid dehydrogenase [Oscillospiraceae bacterium]|jgi:glycerate dehydrogenase|nr:D-2-hydroxyacid dehydrogenase [Oscillospiraceae bacterium]